MLLNIFSSLSSAAKCIEPFLPPCEQATSDSTTVPPLDFERLSLDDQTARDKRASIERRLQQSPLSARSLQDRRALVRLHLICLLCLLSLLRSASVAAGYELHCVHS